MGSTTYYITNGIKTLFSNFVYNYTQNNFLSPFHIPNFSPTFNTPAIQFEFQIVIQNLDYSLPKLKFPPEVEVNFVSTP